MKDKKLLADVLMYHVNSAKVFSSQLTNELLDPSLLTVDGKAVDIRINIYPNSVRNILFKLIHFTSIAKQAFSLLILITLDVCFLEA